MLRQQPESTLMVKIIRCLHSRIHRWSETRR